MKLYQYDGHGLQAGYRPPGTALLINSYTHGYEQQTGVGVVGNICDLKLNC
ncbi:MAG: hypothetical protein QOH41_76 [Blastocatellia bacterium]|jgi:hypothetical protein|nr:hypothetical protein [Blastocatellia bacterium]